MISDFKHLPNSVKMEIDKVRKAKPTQAYEPIDFGKYMPEILSSFGLSKYKGMDHLGSEITFMFSQAKLIHSLSKGDCHNYPDTYISLSSDDIKSVGSTGDSVATPVSSFLVVPKNTLKISNKDVIAQLNQKIAKVYKPEPPMLQWPDYYSVGGSIFAVAGQLDMGERASVYDCTKKCKKLDYRLEHPPCGS